ncbi:MAG: helix-turn-helix transcriptional regulator [Patescibacteria group bacterium]
MTTTIGERIKTRREYLEMSQENLSEKAGVSRAYINQLENNRSLRPSAPVLFEIANALDVTMGDLLGKVERTGEEPLELTTSMKKAIELFPELEKVKDEMPNWRYRGRYPTNPQDWFAIYSILKRGKREDD